jgi:uncharacterized membrane protein
MTTPPAPPILATIRAFLDRPRLLAGIIAGLAAAILLWLIPDHLSWSARAILSWDSATLTFVGLMMHMMSRCDIKAIEARAAAQDEGRGLTLLISVLAAAASLFAIADELGQAKADHGLIKGLRVALAFVTIALSWLFTHLIFALHYAHEYYSPEVRPNAEARVQRAGLSFPGGEAPDYWDFLHFSLVIGVASQTADIAFTAKSLRRIGTIHSVLSFAFNTVALALTINLLAGLF